LDGELQWALGDGVMMIGWSASSSKVVFDGLGIFLIFVRRK
jgi:hypothetical protein